MVKLKFIEILNLIAVANLIAIHYIDTEPHIGSEPYKNTEPYTDTKINMAIESQHNYQTCTKIEDSCLVLTKGPSSVTNSTH